MLFTRFSAIPNLAQLSSTEVKAYYDWFLSIVPERLQALPSAVAESPGFEGWCADFTPVSLQRLGEWFADSVETRPRTSKEIAELEARAPYPIAIPGYELSERTFGNSYDVGIYFAEVLRRTHPKLRWTQVSGRKNNIQFGNAALSGFGPVDFSPVHIVITLAYGVAAQQQDGNRLMALYETWSRMVRS